MPRDAYSNYAHPYFVLTDPSSLPTILPLVVQYVLSPTLLSKADKATYLPAMVMQFTNVSLAAYSVMSTSAAYFTRDVLWLGPSVSSEGVSEGNPTSLVLDLANAQGAIALGGSDSALYIQVCAAC